MRFATSDRAGCTSTSFEPVEVSDGPADEEYKCTTEGFEISVLRMPVVVARDIATSMADSGTFSVVFDPGWLISSEEPGPLGAAAESTGEVLVEPPS